MRFATKDFLSTSADESGSIICKLTTDRVKDMNSWCHSVKSGGYMSGNVRIADCSDHIILDFDCTGQKGFDKRVAKLDKLISKLQDMRHQMDHMWENHLRDLEHYKKEQEIKDAA
jgi:hypothetical protein